MWSLANGKKLRLDYEKEKKKDEKESGVDVDAKTFLESRRPIVWAAAIFVELENEDICCYSRKQKVKRFFMEQVRHGLASTRSTDLSRVRRHFQKQSGRQTDKRFFFNVKTR